MLLFFYLLADCTATDAILAEGGEGGVLSDPEEVGIGGGSGSAEFGIPTREIIIPNVPWTAQKFSCPYWNPRDGSPYTLTCGPTSTAMAVSYVNNTTLNADSVKGLVVGLNQEWPCGQRTSISQLKGVLNANSITNRVVIFNANQLIQALESRHPVVAPVLSQDPSTNMIRTSGDPKIYGHFMLIVGITPKEIVVNDPGRSLEQNGKYRRFPLQDFLKAWWIDGQYQGLEIIGSSACSGAATQTCGICGVQSRTCGNTGWSSWSQCVEQSCGIPQITVSPTTGSPGTTFGVSGKGITPFTSVTPMARRPNGSVIQLISTFSDATGAISYRVTSSINSVAGLYELWAIDDGSGKLSPIVNFSISGFPSMSPSISIAPSQGIRGTMFAITGSSFGSFSNLRINVTRPDSSILMFSTSSDVSGQFQYTLATSATTLLGSFSVSVIDDSTAATSNAAIFKVNN